MQKQINLIELFAGTGGFAKGLEEAGFKIKKHYFSEINKHAIANYKYNFKHAEAIGSVTDVRGADYQDIDIITFGSPCQDFSLAGKREGLGGEKSSLITEAIRLISEVRPTLFIWENVKGAFSSNNGEDFWAIIQAFANIGGYRLEWQLLNTSWFLPQNRERIYLIGHLADRSTPKVFPIQTEDENLIETQQAQNKLAATVCAGYGKIPTDGFYVKIAKYQKTERKCNIKVTLVLTPGRKEKRQNGRRFKEAGDDSFTINCQDKHGVMITEDGEEIMIRRLTEIECERLQGFPDDWTRYGIYEKKEMVDFQNKKGVFETKTEVKEIPQTHRYQMIGNAVTVNVVKAIGVRLLNKTA